MKVYQIQNVLFFPNNFPLRFRKIFIQSMAEAHYSSWCVIVTNDTNAVFLLEKKEKGINYVGMC